MTDYTPTTEQVRRYWRYGANAWADGHARDDDVQADGASIDAEFDRWLATVRPNPDNKQQIETVAAELPCEDWCSSRYEASAGGGACDCRESREDLARDVLAALAGDRDE